MNVQIIKKNGRPEWAVIPYEEYERLRDAREDAEDTRVIEETLHALTDGSEELVPAALVDRLLDGDNPITVWREHRKISTAQLAKTCHVTPSAISQIEKRKRKPSIDLLRKIAAALNTTVDDLLEPDPAET